MANLDFYALGDDLRSLLRYVFAETDVVAFEMASEYDREARQFTSLTELEATFDLDGHNIVNLQLWSPSVMPRPNFRRINLKMPGHSFRYSVEGAGLIQLCLHGQHDNIIEHSHYGHWSEKGARQRSDLPADNCDWQALAKLSGRIQRHIRRKLAVAKLSSRPIHQQAFSALERGVGLKFSAFVHNAGSSDLTRLAV